MIPGPPPAAAGAAAVGVEGGVCRGRCCPRALPGGSANVTLSLDPETLGNLGTALERKPQKPSGAELEKTPAVPTLQAQRVFKSPMGTRPYKTFFAVDESVVDGTTLSLGTREASDSRLRSARTQTSGIPTLPTQQHRRERGESGSISDGPPERQGVRDA